MKFAFFGTPYVARDTLAILHERGFTPELVITNPDAPRGRGQLLTPSETNVWATERNIPVLTPTAFDEETIATIASHGCEFAIVVAYGSMLPEALIEAFPKGVYNVHYSSLPKYRGASPVETALLHDDTVTGVSIQRMVKRLDAGDVVAHKFETILPTDTTRTLRERLIAVGAELLVEVIPAIIGGTLTYTPQREKDATYAPKIKKEDGCIDLAASPQENWNKFRAYAEWPGTYFFTERNGKQIRVKVTDATLTPDGEFKILRIIPEGKKEMDYETFLR